MRDAMQPCSDALLEVVKAADAYRAELSARDERARARLEASLRGRYPTVRVLIFGSSASGLRVGNSSDVDLSVTLPPREVDTPKKKKRIVYTIAQILSQRSDAYAKLETIAHARVPLVKCLHVWEGVNCDVVPCSELAVNNSALLASYCAAQPLCRQLSLLVKCWAGRRQLNSARDGQLSSYGHVLTCIHYCLAGASPPLVPDLLSPDRAAGVAAGDASCHGFDARFWPRACSADADAELAAVALSYFEYMLAQWEGSSLSLRPGLSGTYRFAKSQWALDGDSGKSPARRLSVEDPFETVSSHAPHDIGRTLTIAGFATLKEEWARAARLLRASVGAPSAQLSRESVAALIEPKPRAAPASAPKWVKSAGCERRVDGDGVGYTALEFLDYYGAGPETEGRWRRAPVQAGCEVEALASRVEAVGLLGPSAEGEGGAAAGGQKSGQSRPRKPRPRRAPRARMLEVSAPPASSGTGA